MHNMPSALRVVRRAETFADSGPLSKVALQTELARRQRDAKAAADALATKEAAWQPKLAVYNDYINAAVAKMPNIPTECTNAYFCVPDGEFNKSIRYSTLGAYERFAAVDAVLRPQVSEDQRLRDPAFWAVQTKKSGKPFDARPLIPSYAQDMAAAEAALNQANSALQIVTKQWADGEAEEARKAAAAAKLAAEAAAEKKRQADLAAKAAAELAAAKQKADEDAALQQKVLLGVAVFAGLYVMSKRR